MAQRGSSPSSMAIKEERKFRIMMGIFVNWQGYGKGKPLLNLLPWLLLGSDLSQSSRSNTGPVGDTLTLLYSSLRCGTDGAPVTRLSSCSRLTWGLNTRRQKPRGPLQRRLGISDLIYHQYLYSLLISASIGSFIQSLYIHRKKKMPESSV